MRKKTNNHIWILYAVSSLIIFATGICAFFAIRPSGENFVIGILIIAICVIIATIASAIVIPIFARYLGDRALFWVRVPERFAVMIIKDKNLQRILMAVTDKRKLALLKQVAKETANENLFEFVPDGQLIWIGPPWLGYTIQTWYENSKDETNPEADPHCALDLMERIWNYGTEESIYNSPQEDISKWGVETKDNIQVTPKIVVVAEVVNPQKAIYGITYFQEAINQEVLIAWKKSVQNLDYFTYTPSEELGKMQDGKTNLQNSAQTEMDKILGFIDDNNNRINLKFFKDDEITVIPQENRNNYCENSPARRIYDDYGFWLKRVELRDIDPTDDDIRNSIQEVFKARNKAATEIEKAIGEKKSIIEKTDGEVYRTKETGEADAYAIKAKLTAKAAGMKKISDSLKLKGDDNNLLLTSEMTIKMMENADYTYLAGQPGDIGSWAMAAVDRMKSGVEKIKAGSETEKAVGFEELKQAWSSLTKMQKNELLEIKQKPQE